MHSKDILRGRNADGIESQLQPLRGGTCCQSEEIRIPQIAFPGIWHMVSLPGGFSRSGTTRAHQGCVLLEAGRWSNVDQMTKNCQILVKFYPLHHASCRIFHSVDLVKQTTLFTNPFFFEIISKIKMCNFSRNARTLRLPIAPSFLSGMNRKWKMSGDN